MTVNTQKSLYSTKDTFFSSFGFPVSSNMNEVLTRVTTSLLLRWGPLLLVS